MQSLNSSPTPRHLSECRLVGYRHPKQDDCPGAKRQSGQTWEQPLSCKHLLPVGWIRASACFLRRVFFVMRILVQFDGQNLFHLAKNAWGPSAPYHYPSYDVQKLARALVSMAPGRTLAEVRFYTGVPSQVARPTLNRFWTNKLRELRNQGIQVYRGRLNAGGQEKGVDVSLALDLVQATYEQRYDVAIIVSQDSDFGPAVRLAKQIAKNQGVTLEFESAFPFAQGRVSPRGVPGTNWVRINKGIYDACIDTSDYR